MFANLSSDFEQKLKEAFSQNNLEDFCDEEKIQKILIYANELFFWNEKINLVGDIRDKNLTQNQKEEIFIYRHIVDSLLPLRLANFKFEKIKSASDVGSGSGLPGVPLAIFLPQIEWNLIERSGKRASFLRNVVAICNLKNVTVTCAQLGEVGGQFDLVVFRAFRQLDEFFLELKEAVKSGGILLSYKGKEEIICEELKSLNLEVDNKSIFIEKANIFSEFEIEKKSSAQKYELQKNQFQKTEAQKNNVQKNSNQNRATQERIFLICKF